MEILNFLFLLSRVIADLILPPFVLRSLVQNALFLKIILLELLVFGPQIVVNINAIVDLLVEDINIGEQIIVLLFSLDKSVLDLDNIGQPSGFFDSIKGLINNLHISLITINQLDFLLVIEYEFGQPLLEGSCRVVLHSTCLPDFDPAPSVEFGIFEAFVELGESAVVVGFVLLVFHFEGEH